MHHMVIMPYSVARAVSPASYPLSRGTYREHHDRTRLTALFGIFCASCRWAGLFKGAAGLRRGTGLPGVGQIGGFIMKLAEPGRRWRYGRPPNYPRGRGSGAAIELFRRYLGVLRG